ncbi:hypothetical protein QTP88_024277 [Uroleucon formosanum]
MKTNPIKIEPTVNRFYFTQKMSLQLYILVFMCYTMRTTRNVIIIFVKRYCGISYDFIVFAIVSMSFTIIFSPKKTCSTRRLLHTAVIGLHIYNDIIITSMDKNVFRIEEKNLAVFKTVEINPVTEFYQIGYHLYIPTYIIVIILKRGWKYIIFWHPKYKMFTFKRRARVSQTFKHLSHLYDGCEQHNIVIVAIIMF